MKQTNKKKFEFPNPFVILFGIILFIWACTYVVPAGAYEREVVDGRTLVVADSFRQIEQSPVSILDLFKAIPVGIESAAGLMIMILIIGGTIHIVNQTGAIETIVLNFKEKIGEKRAYLVLIAIMLFFGFLGAFVGMLEAAIPFAGLCIAIAVSLGYDEVVGISLPFIGIVLGFTAGPTNPWTVGVGHMIGELPIYSGLGFRIVIFIIYMAVAIAYVLWYGKKIRKVPAEGASQTLKAETMTGRKKCILLVFLLMLAVIIYGTLNLGWGMTEMSAIYLISAIIMGMIQRYTANEIAEKFLEGSQSLFIPALAIGVSRAIQVIMEQGYIADTIIYQVSGFIEGLPSFISSICMFILQGFINFFIPSGSGQAMVTLPTLLPIADLSGLSRQVAILAYQFGDGLTNLFFPTVGCLIGFLTFSKIPYKKWLKYIMPLVGIIALINCVILCVAIAIDYGPY